MQGENELDDQEKIESFAVDLPDKSERKNHIIIMVCMLLIAGVVAGVSIADHLPATNPPKSSQSTSVCPPFHLLDEEGQIINPITKGNIDKPYSPRKTCGKCHDYRKITQGFHFQQGAGEKPTADQSLRCAWVTSPGNYGGTW